IRTTLLVRSSSSRMIGGFETRSVLPHGFLVQLHASAPNAAPSRTRLPNMRRSVLRGRRLGLRRALALREAGFPAVVFQADVAGELAEPLQLGLRGLPLGGGA